MWPSLNLALPSVASNVVSAYLHNAAQTAKSSAGSPLILQLYSKLSPQLAVSQIPSPRKPSGPAVLGFMERYG